MSNNETKQETTKADETTANENQDHGETDIPTAEGALEGDIEVESSAQSDGNDAGVDKSASNTEVERVTDQLFRLQADFDNFRRRTRQEREDLQQFANRKVLTDLLPVVDNFERALLSLPEDEQFLTVRTGVEMVYRQMLGILESHGVQAMSATGQPFDPNLHEAVMQEPSEDGQSGIVKEEFQKGYTLHGKVLRPAMVKVTV